MNPAQPRRPWSAPAAWLARAPVADRVDRRNAVMLQILLLLLASLPPLMWIYRIGFVDVAWRPGETVAVLTSMAISAVALGGVWLIRRGRFQLAVRIVLVVAAAATMLAYVTQGYWPNRFEQPIQAVWLIIAGLMVGRRALWLMCGWTLLAFALGSRVDIANVVPPDTPAALAVDALIGGLIFLFITIVVDRSVTALREALDEARSRSDELLRANQRLREEIDARIRTQDQLIHAQKVETVGRLAGGLAHDFNHLLGLVLGYAQRARSSSDPAERADAIEGIEAAARRASAVSRKLLNFSRHDATQVERVDLRAALEEMRPMLQQLFDADTKVALWLPEAGCFTDIDRAHLDLVVLNIAANARDAMAGTGRFDVELQVEDPDRIAIELRDTGPGIEPELLDQVFEPFFTTKPGTQGTGLGLSVVRDLVEHAGGTVTVRSRPGAGAAFRVELAAASPA